MPTAAGRRLMTASAPSRISNTFTGRPQITTQIGEFTQSIYGMMAEQKYQSVKEILSNQLQNFPTSRAALSLLGNVNYMTQDYPGAIEWFVN